MSPLTSARPIPSPPSERARYAIKAIEQLRQGLGRYAGARVRDRQLGTGTGSACAYLDTDFAVKSIFEGIR